MLRLLYGNDKRNPLRTLNLAESDSTGSIFLQQNGFTSAAGAETVLWAGQSFYRDGETRIRANRGNAAFTITYDLQAGSAAELGYLQSQVNRFKQECRLRLESGSGEKVWLEYRWADNLGDLPAPLLGQLSNYFEVLNIEPGWPDDLHSGALITGNIEGVVASLVCAPYAEGIDEAFGVGCAFDDPEGVRLAYGTSAQLRVNFVNNPGFGHATWNTGWSASNAALKTAQEIRPGYTLSFDSAARLYNSSAITTYRYETTPDGSTADGTRCLLQTSVRLPDGGAVNSSIVALCHDGAAVSTTYARIRNTAWYLLTCVIADYIDGDTVGVAVQPGYTVIVDNVDLGEVAFGTGGYLPINGEMQWCEWWGTAHESPSRMTLADNGLIYTPASPSIGACLTAAGWLTPLCTEFAFAGASSGDMLSVYAGTSYVTLTRYTATHLTRLKVYDGSTSLYYDFSHSLIYGEAMHYAIVIGGGAVTLYLNGVPAATVGLVPNLDNGTSLKFSDIDGVADGWRIFEYAMTEAQIGTLYTNELPIKQRYGKIGMPAFLTLPDYLNTAVDLDNIAGTFATQHYNWCIAAGVPGDAPARVRWELGVTSDTTLQRVYWLAARAADQWVSPVGNLWLDFSGTSDVGGSSGYAYQSASISAPSATYAHFGYQVDDPETCRGRFLFIARLKVTGQAATVSPYFKVGNSAEVYGESVEIAADTDFILRTYQNWDMWINWDGGTPPVSLTVGLFALNASGGSGASVAVDFIQLLPYPNCRVACEEATFAADNGDTVIIEGTDAWVLDVADGTQNYRFAHRGDEVTIEPGKINYLFLMHGEDGETFTIDHQTRLGGTITPRWLTAGPPR